MNNLSSNAEYAPPRHVKLPGALQVVKTLRAEGDFSARALIYLIICRLPYFITLLVILLAIGDLALWQPLRKALFSLREGLNFSYGDFILFFLISVLLAFGALVMLRRLYRHESEMMYLCNYGVVATEFKFDTRKEFYYFTDANGETQRKAFIEDFTTLYPFISRLRHNPRGAFNVFAADAAKRNAGEIAEGKKTAYIVYAPEHPFMCHMVVQNTLQEYTLRKSARVQAV